MGFAGIGSGIMSLIKYEKYKIHSVVIVFLFSLTFAILLERLYSTVILTLSIKYSVDNITLPFSKMALYRTALLFCIIFFLLIHLIVKIPVFYNAVFKYKYALAASIFLLLVIGKIHFSSIGMYDYILQPGYGSEFVSPVFGTPRNVRSDEWIVDTSVQLASQFEPERFGRFNYVLRGTATENMPLGIAINLTTLAFPLHLFFLFGVEYGISALWVGTLIITFMVAFELMYIISRKNRLLALTGACLVAFSPFFQWWSYVSFITAGMGTLVCLYYFINTDKRIKRLLFSLGIVIFFSQFVLNIYPAWQVPSGLLYLGLTIWIVLESWTKVKQLDKIDWGIVGLTVVLISAVVATYIWESREYISIMSNTVYPGARHESGGGVGIGHILNRWMNGGAYAPASGFRNVIYESHMNVCEFGGFYTLFPLPIMFVSYMMIRKRAFDLLSVILIAITLIIGTYAYFGWPVWLARISMMSYSTPDRAMDIAIYAQVFLLICATSRYTEGKEKSDNSVRASTIVYAIAVSVCLSYIALRYNDKTFLEPINHLHFVIMSIGFVLVAYCIFDLQRNKKILIAACVYMICLSCVTWMSIHPVMKGLDAIYSKPLSAKVAELATDTDEKWVSLTFEGPAVLVASGASTINSTNFYPNLDLWHKLDPDREFEHIYNRYAHISVSLTTEDTWFELLHHDWIILHLSYLDLSTAGVKYIHTTHILDDYEGLTFDLVYDEGGSFVYYVSYEAVADHTLYIQKVHVC